MKKDGQNQKIIQEEHKEGAHASNFGEVFFFTQKARRDKEFNQDSLAFLEEKDRLTLVVSDGIGSLANSHEASKAAVSSYVKALKGGASYSDALNASNEAVLKKAPNSGCTLSALSISGGNVSGVNIGDSPFELWSKEAEIRLESKAQTPLGYWEEMQEVMGLEERELPNVLLESLGASPITHLSYPPSPYQSDDLLLLGSDGLFDNLRKRDFASFCREHVDLPELFLTLKEYVLSRSLDEDYVDDDITFFLMKLK